jgi:TetR/AcrR family transcriptional regulator, transcriptional repressor for nem operon
MARRASAASLDTRRRLADAALDQFHRKGYNGTSVQDLVSAAAAPKGTFYNHFRSKEDLALHAVLRYAAGMCVDMLRDRDAGPARDRIRRHLAHVLAAAADFGPERGCLLATLSGEVPTYSDALARAVSDALDAWVSALAGAIDEARAAGDLATRESGAELAAFIVSAYEGAAVRAKAAGSLEPMRNFERMAALLLA